MSTLLQRKLAENIVNAAKSGKRTNKKELLVSAGYDLTTAKATPGRTLEQKGVQEELEYLGFDAESAKKVVKNILMRGKEENRLKAADMIFKVGGDYAAEKHINLNIPVPIYGGRSIRSVQGHDSNKEDISGDEAN